MALNYSQRPIFSAHSPDDNLVSPMRFGNAYIVEGVPDLNNDGFAKQWHSNRDMEDRGGSQDSAAVDILDLLPSDPFGMDISSSFTAITRIFILNNAMRLREFSGSIGFDKSNAVSAFDENCDEMLDDDSFQDGDVGAPHPALSFAIGYLGTKDLLMVSKVCKSLHSTVSDPLIWKHVHVDQPLKEKITDDNLLELTNMARGSLECLSVIECPKLTDDGLKRVLESNPKLTKLSVSGCTRISIDGIVNILKASKSTGIGLKHLRVGGLYGTTQGHFEELKFLLGTDKYNQKTVRKPHFYKRGKLYRLCDDDCALDVEMCPRCQNIRIVYDCPAAACRANKCSTQSCRACTLCIQRCMECGRCINGEYEETFCLNFRCSDCWERVPKCQDRKIRPSADDPSRRDVHG